MANMNVPLVINRDGEIYSPDKLVAHVDSKVEMEKLNALGVDQTVTTLTTILPDVIQQKNYTVNLTDYVDIEVGSGNPFAAEFMNWKTSVADGGFESGIIDTASNRANAQEDGIKVEPIKYPATGWKKDVTYNIFEEGYFAAGTKNLDYIRAKYEARKTAYDLGFQTMIFTGLQQRKNFNGLLTLDGVTSNASLITKFLKDMTAAEFNKLLAGLLPAYVKSSGYTAVPNRFVIPAEDYFGLGAMVSENFIYPGANRLEVLENALKQITKKADFKVLPLVYSSKEENAKLRGLNKNRYFLYNKDPKSFICRVPLDFTITLPNSVNNFDYTSAAYSRFTGVQPLRAPEGLYFDF